MRIIPLVVVGLVLALAPSAAAQDCSKDTATRAVAEHELNPFLVDDPVVQVLCGSFTGPGSTAMAVMIGGAPTCWGTQHWAVLDHADGAWRPVHNEWRFLAGELVAVGDDLRVTTVVHQIGDPRCLPTGGTEARIFHWDGSRMVASEPTQVEPRKPLRTAYFGIARNGECVMTQRMVRCEFTRNRRKREGQRGAQRACLLRHRHADAGQPPLDADESAAARPGRSPRHARGAA